MRLLCVELLLDAKFLLRLAHRRACVVGELALLHFFKVLRDLLQRVRELLLLLDGTVKVGRLLLRCGYRCILQRLLRARRRILQHCERVVSIAHFLALILLQNVLLVRLRANEILQRLDLLVEMLLLRDLLLGLFLRVLGIFFLRSLGALLGLLLHLGLLLRERHGELAHGRRKFRQPHACVGHRLAEKIERQLRLPGELLGVLPRGHRKVFKIHAPAHLPLHRAPAFELLRLQQNLLRIREHLRQFHVRLRRLRSRKFAGDLPHPRLQPAPVARRVRARREIAQLPPLARCELRETLHRLLQIVPALQHAEDRVHFVQLRAYLRGVRAGRDSVQRLDRRDRLPHVGHKLIVRTMADFLEVAVRLEKFRAHFPPRISEQHADLRGERLLLRDRLQRFREFRHRSIRRPGLVRRIAHQRDRAQAEFAIPVVEPARSHLDHAVEFPELQHRDLDRLTLISAIFRRERLHEPLAALREHERRGLRTLLSDPTAPAHHREDVLDGLRLRSRHLEPARKRRPLHLVRAGCDRHLHQPLPLAHEDDAILREHCGLLGKCDRLRQRLGGFRTARDIRGCLQRGRLQLARGG